jgi:predicted TIM-barrel fold metal-dependent hydrolase
MRRKPELRALAKYPNVAVKATGQAGYAEGAYPFRSFHEHLHRCFDAFGPERMFWGHQDHPDAMLVAAMRDGVRRGTAVAQGRELELVTGEAVCNWVGWSRPA